MSGLDIISIMQSAESSFETESGYLSEGKKGFSDVGRILADQTDNTVESEKIGIENGKITLEILGAVHSNTETMIGYAQKMRILLTSANNSNLSTQAKTTLQKSLVESMQALNNVSKDAKISGQNLFAAFTPTGGTAVTRGINFSAQTGVGSSEMTKIQEALEFKFDLSSGGKYANLGKIVKRGTGTASETISDGASSLLGTPATPAVTGPPAVPAVAAVAGATLTQIADAQKDVDKMISSLSETKSRLSANLTSLKQSIKLQNKTVAKNQGISKALASKDTIETVDALSAYKQKLKLSGSAYAADSAEVNRKTSLVSKQAEAQ